MTTHHLRRRPKKRWTGAAKKREGVLKGGFQPERWVMVWRGKIHVARSAAFPNAIEHAARAVSSPELVEIGSSERTECETWSFGFGPRLPRQSSWG